jgi:hypothetical protein
MAHRSPSVRPVFTRVRVASGALILCALEKYSTAATGNTVMAPVTLTEPEVAEIPAVPILKLVANPPLVIVAMAGFEDAQVTVFVISWVLLSLKVPAAINCSLVPSPIDDFAGVMIMEVNTGGVTDSESVALIDPEVAVIVDVPTLCPLANPALLIEAAPAGDAAQTTVLVMS